MSTPVVTVNGIPLGGAQAYGWPLVAGVNPHRELWTVSAKRAADLEPLLGKPQVFKIEGPRGDYEVSDLYPLRILPSSTPYLRTVEVVDRRWLLSRQYHVRHYNIRRITGRKRFNDDGGQLQEENAVFDPDVEFAAYSLSLQEEPWSPRGALADLLLSLFGARYRIEPDAFQDVREIRDLVIDDDGRGALSVMLNEFPGASLYIARDGTAVVYDELSGKERDVFVSLAPPHAVGSVVEDVDYRHLRPSSVRVLFTPEIECRADANDAVGTRTRGRLQLDQVVQSVDGRLQVVDTVTGETRIAGLGSWEQADAVYAAWGAFGVQQRQLSNHILARHAASGFKLAEKSWATTPSGIPDDQAARRIGSAVDSWRRDFAMDQQAFSRMQSLRPHRVAILNRIFGTRAPSPVYTDWCRLPSFKGHAEARDRGWNIAGGVATDEPLSSGQRAPAQVSEIAPGMFHIEPRQQDWGGLSQATFFGRPTSGVMPANDLGGKANRTGEDHFAALELVDLDPSLRLAVILTAIPGLPNRAERLHEHEVTPSQAAAVIGRDVGPCLGPPVTIRIPSSLMTAKFAYSDALRTRIEDVVLGDDTVSALSSLLVNEDFVRAFAEAAAATVYARWLDKPQGTQSVDLDPNLEPVGAISRVEHRNSGGVVHSLVTFSEPAELNNVWRFLDQGVRRRIVTGGEAAPTAGLVTGR